MTDPDYQFMLRRFEQIAAEIKEGRRSEFSGGAGGDGTSGMEARVAKVEASLEHIQTDISDVKGDIRSLRDNARTDFRLLFGAIIAVALGLAGLMAKGFHWL
jgi:hypothetical protein